MAKKIILVLALLAGIGGAVWWFTMRAGAAPAAVGQALSAEHTVALVGVEQLAAIGAQVDESLKALPEEVRAQLPIGSAEQRQKALGFDPTTADGWKSIGLDSAAGLAVAIDARVQRSGRPEPIFLAKVTDREALKGALGRWGLPVEVGAKEGAAEAWTVGGQPFLVGERAGYTAAISASDDDVKKGFAVFLAGEGEALGGADAFRKAFDGAPDGGRLFGWAGTRGATTLAGAAAGDKARDTVGFYQDLFPAAAFYAGIEGGGARLVATEKGEKILARLFSPPRKPPAMARYLPREGWAATRFTVNLGDVFGGIGDLMPPTTPDAARMGLGMGKILLATQLGLDWDVLAAALSGHAVFGMELESAMKAGARGPAAIRWLGVLGVGETDKADQLLGKLTELAAKAGVERTDAEVGGHKGYRLAMPGGLTVTVVRAGDVIVAGPGDDAVKAAVDRARGDSLAATDAGEVLDESGVVYASVVDLTTVLKELEAGQDPELKEMMAAMRAHPAFKELQENPRAAVKLVLDDGLRVDGEGPVGGLPAFAGMMAAVAIPAFTKYMRRSQTIEASINVQKLFHSSVAYYNTEHATREGEILPLQFPGSAPETPGNPSEVFCKDGRPVKFTPTEETWSHPTWRALNFAVDDPFRYSYTFIAEGTGAGARFTARARGDLDCDGVLSTFERVGTIDEGGSVFGPGPNRENELE